MYSLKQKDILCKLVKNPSEVHTLLQIGDSDKILVTYMNQHCYNVFLMDEHYSNLMLDKFCVFAEGRGMFWALNYLNYGKYNMFNATDIYEQILQKYVSMRKRIFIIGGSFHYELVMSKIPSCSYRNGYFKELDLENIVKEINDKKPDVIFIGMGVPKQEEFAYKLSGVVNTKVILCVGNFFEFYFKTKKRAPKFLRKVGLEWFFRLISEPNRLWKRYIIGIPTFIYRIFIKRHFKLSNE